MSAGLGAGILLGFTVALMLNSLLSPQAVAGGGWRIPFLLGGLSGITALYLRRWLQETPVFLSMQLHWSLSAELPLKRVILNHKIGSADMDDVSWHRGGSHDDTRLVTKAGWVIHRRCHLKPTVSPLPCR
ncbi:hypothetical protein [Enterobacter ludwigii]|uniref:hypothetical protein n=1 Tax=Enterobacter ludwigii TaxID=299767 RepID=UPI003F71D8D6